MDQPYQNHPGIVSSESGSAVNVRKDSEGFGKLRNGSERFGTVRKGAESFRNIPKVSERMENHTLTVREAARLFEAAGVARTERSIVNWCQMNRQGIARLDSYFDPNERKYYLTPQSVECVILEEIQRTKKHAVPPASESFGTIQNAAEKPQKETSVADDERIEELEKEVLDLKIVNKGKDYFIDQLQKERNGFIDQLMVANRKMGELETKLLRLESSDSKVTPPE